MLFVCLLISGCATKGYQGAGLPPSKTSNLALPRNPNLLVREINGYRPLSPWAGNVSVPHGPISLTVVHMPNAINHQGMKAGGTIGGSAIENSVGGVFDVIFGSYDWEISFVASPGRNYALTVPILRKGGKDAVPYIIELESNKPVSKAKKL